jgi:hypothetical protein
VVHMGGANRLWADVESPAWEIPNSLVVEAPKGDASLIRPLLHPLYYISYVPMVMPTIGGIGTCKKQLVRCQGKRTGAGSILLANLHTL